MLTSLLKGIADDYTETLILKAMADGRPRTTFELCAVVREQGIPSGTVPEALKRLTRQRRILSCDDRWILFR